MQEPIPGAPPGATSLAFGRMGQLLFRASKVSAIGGGVTFVAIVLMSIVSIVGRKLFSAPVPGDVEVLQMAAAFASASFFAYCHLNGGDVKVDFFTAKASPATVHRLDAFGSLFVGLFGAVITWRAAVGALAIKEAGETSMILGWPVWMAQMLMVPGFLLLALAGFYMVGLHWRLSHSADASHNGVAA
ncbi:TRAP transporter small permease [Rhodoferax sp.]|uniref:TRAP transporter small permease n=1 Tax=Rhodoferax sp. TaxID=50421 RepID=UPI00260626D9|nr:TRAP transporter small permease [Rhodoferax sp.]MDD4999520.1 TRAP transporter small permease [Thiomonas arsenitoxydans]MDD5479499.1 TRAP transporter small permease [Rhodoferax sp.]